MNFDELKVYSLSFFTLTMTYSNIDKFLKLVLLLITIGYGIDKWIVHRRNSFK